MADEIHEESNPITEVRRAELNTLIIERTHATPVTATETHDINNIKSKIAKIDGVISLWQDRRKVLQDIIDEYDTLYKEKEPEKL